MSIDTPRFEYDSGITWYRLLSNLHVHTPTRDRWPPDLASKFAFSPAQFVPSHVLVGFPIRCSKYRNWTHNVTVRHSQNGAQVPSHKWVGHVEEWIPFRWLVS